MSSCLRLLLIFLKVTVMAFGGAYAAMPLIEKEVVDAYALLSYEEFSNLLALDELTPGPIIINSATFVGMKVAGFPGALCASLGCIIPPCVIAMLLMAVYRRYSKVKAIHSSVYALKCMTVALIGSSLLNMILALVRIVPGAAPDVNVTGVILAAASFFAIRKLKLNPLAVMLCCGAVNLLLGSFL